MRAPFKRILSGIAVGSSFGAIPAIWFAAVLLAAPVWASSLPPRGASVPLCHGVSFTASYLAATGADHLPGFQFTIANHTSGTIRLAEPVPSSSDWYALSDGRWLWRASNGTGGSLLNALNRRGRVFAYAAQASDPPKTIAIGPRQTRMWIENELENPVLAYKPGCAHCSYPGEREYRVIFAYAYLPGAGDGRGGLLRCGLRSTPVPMPPKPKPK